MLRKKMIDKRDYHLKHTCKTIAYKVVTFISFVKKLSLTDVAKSFAEVCYRAA